MCKSSLGVVFKLLGSVAFEKIGFATRRGDSEDDAESIDEEVGVLLLLLNEEEGDNEEREDRDDATVREEEGDKK